MKSTDLIVPLFLLCGTVLVAPHLAWGEAKIMALISLLAAVVFFIILEIME